MSSTPALLDPADRARQRDEDAQYYRQVLHKFIAMGTDLAEAVHRQALADPAAPHNQPEDEPAAPSPTPKQAITFDRLTRCVRRTIALARKLSEPSREAPGPKLHLKECSPEECPNKRRPEKRGTDSAETDALHAEPCERPEGADCDADEDLGDDLDEQSLADLIASIRHDTALATLSDAELRQHRTPPKAQGSAQEGVPKRDVRPLRPSRSDPPKEAPEGAPAKRAQGRRPNERAAQDHSINPWHPAPRHRPASSLIRTPGHDARRRVPAKTHGR